MTQLTWNHKDSAIFHQHGALLAFGPLMPCLRHHSCELCGGHGLPPSLQRSHRLHVHLPYDPLQMDPFGTLRDHYEKGMKNDEGIGSVSLQLTSAAQLSADHCLNKAIPTNLATNLAT